MKKTIQTTKIIPSYNQNNIVIHPQFQKANKFNMNYANRQTPSNIFRIKIILQFESETLNIKLLITYLLCIKNYILEEKSFMQLIKQLSFKIMTNLKLGVIFKP